jgi:hypothetical protein
MSHHIFDPRLSLAKKETNSVHAHDPAGGCNSLDLFIRDISLVLV